MLLELGCHRWRLQQHKMYIIGNGGGNSIKSDQFIDLKRNGVDPRHALLKVTSDGCYLVDLYSATGTYLNGKRLEALTRVDILTQTAKLRFGTVELNYKTSLGEESFDSSGFQDGPKCAEKSSDSVIPETQVPDADDLSNANDDSCIPETQLLLPPSSDHGRRERFLAHSGVSTKSFTGNDDVFRIGTQEFNENFFEDSNDSLMTSMVRPQHSSVTPQGNNFCKQTPSKVIADNDVKICGINSNNKIDDNANAIMDISIDRMTTCTPDIFEIADFSRNETDEPVESKTKECSTLKEAQPVTKLPPAIVPIETPKIITENLSDSDLQPTQIFPVNEGAGKFLPVTEIRLSQKENTKPPLPSKLLNSINMAGDDILEKTQIFPSRNIKNKTPTAINSTLLISNDKDKVRDAASFFADLEQNSVLNLQSIAKDCIEKATSSKNNVMLNSSPAVPGGEFDTFCTPQIIKDHFDNVESSMQSNSAIPVLKRQRLFVENSDGDDLENLLTGPKVSRDFDALLPHLQKKNVKADGKSELQESSAMRNSPQHQIATCISDGTVKSFGRGVDEKFINVITGKQPSVVMPKSKNLTLKPMKISKQNLAKDYKSESTRGHSATKASSTNVENVNAKPQGRRKYQMTSVEPAVKTTEVEEVQAGVLPQLKEKETSISANKSTKVTVEKSTANSSSKTSKKCNNKKVKPDSNSVSGKLHSVTKSIKNKIEQTEANVKPQPRLTRHNTYVEKSAESLTITNVDEQTMKPSLKTTILSSHNNTKKDSNSESDKNHSVTKSIKSNLEETEVHVKLQLRRTRRNTYVEKSVELGTTTNVDEQTVNASLKKSNDNDVKKIFKIVSNNDHPIKNTLQETKVEVKPKRRMTRGNTSVEKSAEFAAPVDDQDVNSSLKASKKSSHKNANKEFKSETEKCHLVTKSIKHVLEKEEPKVKVKTQLKRTRREEEIAKSTVKSSKVKLTDVKLKSLTDQQIGGSNFNLAQEESREARSLSQMTSQTSISFSPENQLKRKRKGAERNDKEEPKRLRPMEKDDVEEIARSSYVCDAISNKTKLKVCTTMVDPRTIEKLEKEKSDVYVFVKDPLICNLLVMDSEKRTYKFLIAMARGIPIVKSDWLHLAQHKIPHLSQHMFRNASFEHRHNFNILKSLKMANEKKVLAGYDFVCTSNVVPAPNELKAIIKCAGGTMHNNVPSNFKQNQKLYLISSPNDKSHWHKYRRQKCDIVIVSSEAVMASVVQQKIDLESHRLE